MKIRQLKVLNNYKVFDYVIMTFLSIPLFSETVEQYVALFVFALFLFIKRPISKILFKNSIDFIPAYILLVWLYGVMIGLLRGNEFNNIIQNFAGMALYMFYYLFLNRNINIKTICDIICFSSFLVTLELIISFILHSNGVSLIWPFSNIGFNKWSNSIETGIKVLPYVLEAVSIWGFFVFASIKKKITNVISFGFSAFSILYTNNSGGSLLAFIAILGVVLFCSVVATRKSKKYWFLSLFFFIIVVIVTIIYESENLVLYNIFSLDSSGNDKRMFQFDLVFDRFKILGNGLGATFNYFYANKSIDTYGLEVSYLNLVDKFGVFSFPLIWFFIKSFIFPVTLFIRNVGDNKTNACAIGLLGYLFIALGNPVLFAPYNVLAHIFSLLITRNNINQQKQEREDSIV